MQERHRTWSKTLGLAVVASAALLLVYQVSRPLPASLLTYADQSSRYADAPFAPEEAAGISLLTALGAVEGYPDGTFHPERTLNRAEFLKITLKSSPRSQELPSRPSRCFPDVRREDWFSPFVCFGKEENIIAGYPDGLFHPGNPVNYAEALKMLVEIYGYPRAVVAQDEWFSSYVRVAKERGVFLFSALPLNTPLFRGQMARLAAAFRAEHEGELSQYLMQERDETPVAASMSSAFSGATTIHSSSSVPSATSASVRSHLLLLGALSDPITDAVFLNNRGDVFLRKVTVRLDRKVKSLRGIHMRNADGEEIAVLSVDTNDTQERKNWLVTLAGTGTRIPSEELHLQFSADLFERGMGGVAGELVHVDRMTIIIQDVGGESSWELLPTEKHTPYHQTVQGRITAVRNALEEDGVLEKGADRLVGTFAITGEALPATTLSIKEFQFTVEEVGVEGAKWRLQRDGVGGVTCFRSSSNSHLITCPIIEGGIGELVSDPVTFKILADVKVTAAGQSTLRVFLDAPGGVGEEGAVRWSDGTTDYTWLELPQPVALGSLWQVR